ncbi:unnamed protein product [Closterium sp. NIES-65]|nr:unnamed protein product [Closterium sp. NIES-65]
MYALPTSANCACYLCVPPDPGIEPAALRASEAAALGASVSPALGTGETAAPGAGESALSGTAPAQALYTFTLDSGASRSFFRDSTTLTPLSRPVSVCLADPSRGPVRATSSTVLPCPAVQSGTLSGLHLPSFSTNLVAASALQAAGVHQFTPAYERVTHCTCAQTGRHLATFTRQPGSDLYTLTTESPQGRQCTAPHSSSFPPTEAPLQTLHLDVWGPAHVREQGHERYFLRVVDEYTCYTTVFPLRTKAFFEEHDITQLLTLPASPQQNGVAERRIGLVMEVARTSMIHAAAPHFLWPFVVRLAMPFRDTTADKLSAHAVPCVFLGFVPDALGWQFYHPTSRHVFPSQDVTFDESVPFYRLFPYRTTPLPSPPLFLAPGAPQVDPLPTPGPAPSGVSQVDPPPLTAPVEVTGDSGPAEGGPARGATSGGAEPGGAEPGSAEPGGAESGAAEGAGAGGFGAAAGASAGGSGATASAGAGGSGAAAGAGAGGSGVAAGGGAGGSGATAGAGAGGSGAAAGAGAGGSGAAAEADAGGSGAAAGAGAEGSKSAVALSPWSSCLRPRVPLTSQQLHDWYGPRQGRASGARGSATGGVSAIVTGAGSGAGPEGARIGGTGAAGAGCAAEPEGAAAGDPRSGGAAAGDTEAEDPGTGGAGSGGAAAGGAGP